MRKMIEQFLSAFSTKEKIFLLLAMITGLLIGGDYAVIRPVSHSFFIHFYGSKAFPYVWLCTVPINLLAVSLYNYFLPRLGCFRLFCVITALIAFGNFLTGLFIEQIPFISFAFYIWKEVYVLIMLQQLWSVIHATIALQEAKYLYGVLFGFGALGGFLGSLVPGFLAVKMGSQSLLFFTLPIYAVLVVVYLFLLRHAGPLEEIKTQKTKQSSSFSKGMQLISSSKLLMAILCMTVFMQITATITDFQFQSFLEKVYPEKDLRTEFFGRLTSFGNVLTMFSQFFGTFLLIRFLGLQKTHMLVPFLLALSAISFVLFPSFGPISCGFLLIKCFDFSIFAVIKEMLYIPMRIEEKFQAKAIIDVFVYRSAKVVASLAILGLQLFLPSYGLSFLSFLNLSLFVAWCFLIAFLRTSYQDAESLAVR